MSHYQGKDSKTKVQFADFGLLLNIAFWLVNGHLVSVLIVCSVIDNLTKHIEYLTKILSLYSEYLLACSFSMISTQLSL